MVTSLFLWAAILGLAIALMTHLLSLAGVWSPSETFMSVLTGGALVVALPGVLGLNELAGGVARREFWRTALRGCPDWMRRMTYGVLLYAVAHFLWGVVMSATGGDPAPRFPEVVPLPLYAITVSLLYSRAKVRHL